jgi:hypothetical protein
MKNKQKLGQFFTTNYSYILQNMFIPENINTIIEPFVGNGDLLKFLNKEYLIECYDIEPNLELDISIVQQDTLTNPPDYSNKFILTNPPYLARNKSPSKEIFEKYNANDLYKCFINSIITNKCLGGIIIIPLNFWSSCRKNDILLRESFLNIYLVNHLNIFEEQVFTDTSYTVCCFQFELRTNKNEIISLTLYPDNKSLILKLNSENNYTFGGEIFNLPVNKKYTLSRWTSKNSNNTNINMKCIDDNTTNKICLSIGTNEKLYRDTTPNLSARTYGTLVITPEISMEQQELLVKLFNEFLTDYRIKYNSLFLTNYRENNRKRISFDLVYKITNYLMEKIT